MIAYLCSFLAMCAVVSGQLYPEDILAYPDPFLWTNPDGAPGVDIFRSSFGRHLPTYLHTIYEPIYAPNRLDPEMPFLPDHRIVDAAFVLKNSPFTCLGLKDGYYADLSYNCVFFHQCEFYMKTDNRWYIREAVFECKFGTKFNQTTKTCDYAERVSCDSSVVAAIVYSQISMKLLPTPILTPTPMSTPTLALSKAESMPNTSFKCNPEQHIDGFYYADEETNCKLFHRCIYTPDEQSNFKIATQRTFMCAEGTLFNQTTVSCMVYDMVDCFKSRDVVKAQVF
ncbi:hypothetical protein GQR58_012474 [Nymphon striatum]|nr:hypothetical protein GQR58_012474 [Nymphon striatum]